MTAANLFTKAFKLLYAGATQEALDALTEAIQLDPQLAEAYSYRGVAYYQLDDYDSALEGYDRLLRCERVLPRPWSWQARTPPIPLVGR